MLNGAHIGIVDDDQGMRAALEDLVLSIGLTPRCFASAADFLADDDRSELCCLILDVKMPGMSGLRLQEVLSAEPIPPTVIILSSHVDGAMRRAALARGAECVLAKPVDDRALIACIEAAVARPH